MDWHSSMHSTVCNVMARTREYIIVDAELLQGLLGNIQVEWGQDADPWAKYRPRKSSLVSVGSLDGNSIGRSP